MHRDEVGKSLEILNIEGKQVAHMINFKHRGKMRIMHLYAAHLMHFEQTKPDWINAFRFRQKSHIANEGLKSSCRLRDG